MDAEGSKSASGCWATSDQEISGAQQGLSPVHFQVPWAELCCVTRHQAQMQGGVEKGASNSIHSKCAHKTCSLLISGVSEFKGKSYLETLITSDNTRTHT